MFSYLGFEKDEINDRTIGGVLSMGGIYLALKGHFIKIKTEYLKHDEKNYFSYIGGHWFLSL